MIDVYNLQLISLFVQIIGTVASFLFICMVYQMNKSQQDRANVVTDRDKETARRVEAVKDRLVITTNEEAKDQTIRELKV